MQWERAEERERERESESDSESDSESESEGKWTMSFTSGANDKHESRMPYWALSGRKEEKWWGRVVAW